MPLTLSDPSLDLFGLPCAVLDFETTWDGDEVPGRWASRWHSEAQFPVECAVLHGRVGLSDFEVAIDRRYRPPVPVHPEATAIHGICDDDLVDCAPFDSDAIEEILEAVKDRVLVAYNLPFDWSLLADECERNGFDSPSFFGLDPLILARVIEPANYSCSLSRVCRRHGRILWAHGAKEDAAATLWYLGTAIRELLHRGVWEAEHAATLGSTWESQRREAIAFEKRMSYRDRDFVSYWTELVGRKE